MRLSVPNSMMSVTFSGVAPLSSPSTLTRTSHAAVRVDGEAWMASTSIWIRQAAPDLAVGRRDVVGALRRDVPVA